MKAAKIIIVLIVAYVLIKWIAGNEEFALPTILPFLGGHEPDFWYDIGGIALIVIALLGLRRLSRNQDDNE